METMNTEQAVTDSKPTKILSDLIKLRRHIGGLEAKKTAGGPMFAIKNAKELMIKFRAGLDDLNMNAWVADPQVTDIPMQPYLDKYGKQKVGSGAMVVTRVVITSDDGSYVVFSGIGHGFDGDDKAAGKASTYAWKDAIIKGLNLPDAEMASVTTETHDTDDESDLPVSPKVTPGANEIAGILSELRGASSMAEVDALSAKAKALKVSRDDALPLSRAFAEARARVK